AARVVSTLSVDSSRVRGTSFGGGWRGGACSAELVGGVVTFSDLTLDKAAPGYWLTATGLGTATSSSFNIIAGAASQLVFGTQPGTITGGKSFSPAVKVRALDGLGNLATTFTGQVTVTLNSPGSGTLSGTTTVAAAGGVATFFSLSVDVAASGYTLTAAAVGGLATFSDLSIDKVGTGYTLFFSADGLLGVESATFDIAPAAASQLVFTVQPTSTAAAATITPAVEVTARDAFGNVATG